MGAGVEVQRIQVTGDHVVVLAALGPESLIIESSLFLQSYVKQGL